MHTVFHSPMTRIHLEHVFQRCSAGIQPGNEIRGLCVVRLAIATYPLQGMLAEIGEGGSAYI